MNTRINKYLSEIGHCSRREADRLIEQGRVTINGKVPAVGVKVQRGDQVRVDGRVVSPEDEDWIYLAFNKPVGIVTTTDTNEPDNIIRYVNYPKRIFPIGRLDKMSEGLIILTNDGDIVNKILRAENKHEKEYEVTVDKPVTDDFIKKMGNGVPIMGTMTKKCVVEKRGTFYFTIVLTQGLNRQIRRMCEYFGYEVTKLKRTRIMNLKLDLPPGQWRDLSQTELEDINKLVADSKKVSSKAGSGIPRSKTKKDSKPKPPSVAASKSGARKASSSRPGPKSRPSGNQKRASKKGINPRSKSRTHPEGSKRASPKKGRRR